MMIEKNKHFSNLTVAQLKVCIMAKRKARGETKMPTNRAGLLLLYQEYFFGPHRRLTPPSSPDASEDENIELAAAESILALHRTDDAAISSTTTDISTTNTANHSGTTDISAANPPNPSGATDIAAVNPMTTLTNAAMIVINCEGESDSNDDDDSYNL